MSHGNDDVIKSANATATATLVSAQAGRLKGLWLRATATAGTAVFKDGGPGGTTIVTINTPAAVGGHPIPIGDEGIPFGVDLHVTLANVDAVTAFYAEDRTA